MEMEQTRGELDEDVRETWEGGGKIESAVERFVHSVDVLEGKRNVM